MIKLDFWDKSGEPPQFSFSSVHPYVPTWSTLTITLKIRIYKVQLPFSKANNMIIAYGLRLHF